MTPGCRDCKWRKGFAMNTPDEVHICTAVPPVFVRNAEYPDGEWMRPRVIPGMTACWYFILRRDE